MRILLAFSVLFVQYTETAQAQQTEIDIINYDITLHVNDSTDEIIVQERISVEFLSNCHQFHLNLDNKDSLGMTISEKGITENGTPIQYRHLNDTLFIRPKHGQKGKKAVYQFQYSGIPSNGLIIGKNKFGKRTFFGDNWPNRAHYWLACLDHPLDKATVNFTVHAPSHYNCIATGTLTDKKTLPSLETVFSYTSNIPLPTKVMVVGLADFSVTEIPHQYNFPLTTWSYTDDAKNGENDMNVSKEIVDYFIKNIGEYPFEKLANVQSTTMFGGMENAGNIFYDEKAIKGNNSMEALIAHEIAHQWFGNSASESDWQHLWLSEGFATYLTDLYFEHTQGTQAMNERLIRERNRVINFAKKYDHAVVDTAYPNLMTLLNPNSYQKGAWFLHMLRQKIGTEVFWKGIRKYYDEFKYSNANTDDFLRIMSKESNIDLTSFFTQWLHTSGHPILTTKLNRKRIEIEQNQSQKPMRFKLDILLKFEDGSQEIQTFNLTKKRHCFNLKKKIESIQLDPNVKLLFEEKVK
ncbi:MAG: M1 family metallopeptidase [Crocinitomicaceae bacterium]|nr:M1 family metallopeptidase [Crocinitomicaceae bacterium]